MNNQDKKVRPVVLVGGGSGGHIFPLVAIAEALETESIPFLFVGSHLGKEREIISQKGWQIITINAGKWRRYFSWKSLFENIFDLWRFFLGISDSFRLLLKTRASTVISKGGYVAMPVCMAAWFLRRRIIIHESDSVMGLTNRISARLADTVLVAFEPRLYPNVTAKFVHCGIPLRQSLRQAAKLKSPQKTRPLILVMAGLQGSVAINEIVRQSLPKLIQVTDIVHITGEADFIQHRRLAAKLPVKLKSSYKPFSFVGRELPYYYRLSDLIVSRSSATVIAEAALFSKALYLIPLPNSASSHQQMNAKIIADLGGAILREQSSLTVQQFTDDIMALLADTDKISTLARNLSRHFYSHDPLKKIISLVK